MKEYEKDKKGLNLEQWKKVYWFKRDQDNNRDNDSYIYQYIPGYLTFDEYEPILTEGIPKKITEFKEGSWLSGSGNFGSGGLFQTSFDSLEIIWKNDFNIQHRNLLNLVYSQYAEMLSLHPHLKLPPEYADKKKYPSLDEWVLYALKDLDFTT